MKKLISFVIALSFTSGCSNRPDSTTESAIAQSSEVAYQADWAGLQVDQAGVPLEQATQIVILLHGYGTKGSDMKSLVDFLGGESRAFVFPTAPISLGQGRFAWATNEQEQAETVDRVATLVRFAAKKYPKAKIAIGGFSQGATVSSLLLTQRDVPLQSALLYSPALELTECDIVPNSVVKVFLAHGQDDKVLPFQSAQKLFEILKVKGIATMWFPFEGGHTITQEALEATRKLLDGE